MTAWLQARRAVLLCLSLCVAAPARAPLKYEALARSYLKSVGIEATSTEGLDLATILAENYPSVQVGIFDVHFPVSALENKRRLTQIRTLALELLEAQLRWVEWVAPEEGARIVEDPDFKQHLRRVTSWIKGWSGSAMARAFQRGERDFILAEDEKVIASYRALSDYLGSGQPLVTDRKERRPVHVYLIPERKEFVELACFLGWMYPEIQHEYWKPSLWGWTFCYFEDTYFLALDYAAADDHGGFTGDYTAGQPMADFNKKGMEQQVVQLSLMALFQSTFQSRMPAALNAGLSANLVIDLYGEVDTRTDGDVRGKTTQDRSVFVPGAPSDGVLPPDYADGRFRSPNNGGDHFLPTLRQVQSDGAKAARDRADRRRTFVLLADNGRDEFILHGPLLVAEGQSLEPPPEPFVGDYLEFMRAYRIAFLDWLRNQGAGSGPDSAKAFARLLGTLAKGGGKLTSAVQQVYGVALSDATASEESLEGRFLAWLDGG